MPATPRSHTARRSGSSNPRAAGGAKRAVIDPLLEDHKRVKKAYRDFEKLDFEKNRDEAAAIVQQVLLELQVHTTLEEELLYPAAHEALRDSDLVDEAEVEHESAHALIDQLMSMSPEDEKYAARFTVLCEYVMHHVKEEEKELFPQLEKAKLDWESLAAAMDERRAALMSEVGLDGADTEDGATARSAAPSRGAAKGDGDARAAGVVRRGGAAGSSLEEGDAGSDDESGRAAREDRPASGVTSSGAAGSRKI